MQAVLTIAGLDPCGAAGILVDVRVIRQHGLHPVAALSAVTAQHGRAVEWLRCVEPGALESQVKCILSDVPVGAVKVGMLGSAETAREAARAIRNWISAPVVFDPVMEASSGGSLLPDAGPDALRPVLEICQLVTPNLKEAEVLLDRRVSTVDQMRQAAKELRQLGPGAVLVKGGHLEGSPVDVLYDGVQLHEFVSPRVTRRDVRGTGCALSAAIACGLALDRTLPEAVFEAKRFVSDNLEAAYQLGSAGPFLP